METHQCESGQCGYESVHGWDHGACQGSCCGDGECCCDDDMDYSEELLDAAMSAKKSLLRDKLKVKLEAKLGKKLDKLADIAVEILISEWEMGKAESDKREELEQKLSNTMWGE